jgi:outer membrane protein assembly factor BamB
VDRTGALVVGSQDDRVHAVAADGKRLWSVQLGGDVDSSVVVGPDGSLYVGSDDGMVYALGGSRSAARARGSRSVEEGR